ncbi:HesA/MoeB/ThiF family protein [Pseudophaeobacter leonis]|uniref:HesA/MoeB/ThiF family protein n=1 Tax=Pseudophaeobacter leonis TaxID=1144477 RepID=UPI0009F73FF1|nr:HesA/MoeB/ThiF family protein [Pseudophaeobacter leonis]
MSRYARQMILPEVGPQGQARLARAHVLVVGAGGLGAPVLQYLAGAGIGAITLLDPDRVDESNLHRQTLFTLADIGRPKVDAAADRLLAATPDLQLVTHAEALTAENVTRFLDPVDLVVDAADSFATSFILSDACLVCALPLVAASVLGQRGYVGGFCGSSPSLRAVFPDLPDTAASCATAGVMGPVVGMIGALQAQMALKLLLQHSPSPLGLLMQIDMASLSLSSFRFDAAPEPENAWRFISPALIPADAQVIDLRPSHEAPQLVTPDARRILPDDLMRAPLDTQRALVLCCRSGVRAWRAARALQAHGFSRIEILAAGDPV